LATFIPDHLLLVNCLVPKSIHTHPKEGIEGIGNSRREELSRAPIFIGKYESNLDFPGRWGIETKIGMSWKGVWINLRKTHWINGFFTLAIKSYNLEFNTW